MKYNSIKHFSLSLFLLYFPQFFYNAILNFMRSSPVQQYRAKPRHVRKEATVCSHDCVIWGSLTSCISTYKYSYILLFFCLCMCSPSFSQQANSIVIGGGLGLTVVDAPYITVKNPGIGIHFYADIPMLKYLFFTSSLNYWSEEVKNKYFNIGISA